MSLKVGLFFTLRTTPLGSTFPKGAISVTCTATDDVGNTITCSFTITVNHSAAPVSPALLVSGYISSE